MTYPAFDSLPSQIAQVRLVSQTVLAGLAMSVGSACSETILIKNNQLWGFRFTLANFHTRWQIHSSEILVLQEGRQLQRITIEPQEQRRAA